GRPAALPHQGSFPPPFVALGFSPCATSTSSNPRPPRLTATSASPMTSNAALATTIAAKFRTHPTFTPGTSSPTPPSLPLPARPSSSGTSSPAPATPLPADTSGESVRSRLARDRRAKQGHISARNNLGRPICPAPLRARSDATDARMTGAADALRPRGGSAYFHVNRDLAQNLKPRPAVSVASAVFKALSVGPGQAVSSPHS